MFNDVHPPADDANPMGQCSDNKGLLSVEFCTPNNLIPLQAATIVCFDFKITDRINI